LLKNSIFNKKLIKNLLFLADIVKIG